MAAFNVYSKNKVLRTTLYASDNSNHQIAIQEDSILPLSTTTQQCIRLEPGDYVDFLESRFWLLEAYTPKQVSTVEWSYDVKFMGVESITKRALMLNSEGVPLEAYHAVAREQVAMVVMNLNRWMGNITDWKVGDCVATGYLDIDYSGGTYCNEALSKIAEAAGVEWWMEGMTINLTRAEHSEPIELAYNNGLLAIERDNADNVPFFTRLFPIGSSRNIDYGSYGHARLQLPSGAKYVERNADKYGVVERYEEDAFADIFPRRTGYVSSVRTEQAKNDDKTEFTIFYFKDQSLNFNPNTYEIGGLVKHIIFQTGDLAGRDFEVNYNANTQEFEIITQWPYDDNTQFPGGLFVPKPGDTYILYNIRMPQEYYPMAEQEFATAVADFLNEHSELTDRSVYKCPTNYINLDSRGVRLTIGQRVRLVSDRFFPGTGYCLSRITRISRNVNRPNQANIEISDVLSKTSQSRMQDSITAVRHEFKTATTTFPDIIRSWDNTLPTDNNIFSARRVLKESLSKKNNDSAAGLIRFLKGVEFGNYEAGESGAKIDDDGNAEMLTAVIRSMLRSTIFVDGLTGEGFGLWKDGNGLANLTLDKLTVRQTLSVMELLINKVRSVGGQIIVSAANGKIKTAQQTADNYTITFETENTFVAGDLMRCSTFTGSELKSYWVEVASADGNSITVPVSEFSGQVPAVGDECVLMGNTTNPLRQNLISIAATEDGQPRVDVLDGVHEKNFNGCLRARLGNLDGINDSWFPAENQPHGNGLYADNAYLHGTFLLVTGEDVKTKFEITEGLIQSSVDSIRQDFMENKGYLNNATFGDNMSKWDTTNEAVFFLAGNKWIWLNNGIYSKKGDYASVRTDEGRTVVFIKNRYIRQTNANLRSKPDFITGADGLKEPRPVYLSFFYRCQTAGTLSIEFENVNKTGFVNFNSIEITKELGVTNGYQQFTADGLWNGTGDFKLSFTGEIYLYMLVLTTDRADALAYKYRTLFEQSDKLIRIAAENFDADGNVLEGSQIITTAKMNVIMSGINMQLQDVFTKEQINVIISGINQQIETTINDINGQIGNINNLIGGINEDIGNMASLMVSTPELNLIVSGIYDEVGNMIQGAGFMTQADFAGMFVIGADGTIQSIVGASTDGVYIKAASIKMEGLVTANNNFKILTDGSIEAVNAKLSGQITATSGKIGGFTISGSGLTNTPFGADNDAYIIFRDDPHKVFAGIGTNVLPESSGTTAAARFENCDDTGFYQTNIAAYFRASGGSFNSAIYIAAGFISGFAVNQRQIDSSMTLTNDLYHISCYNSAEITLTLPAPASAQKGKVYFIRRMNTPNVKLVGKIHQAGEVANVYVGAGQGDTAVLVNDGQFWCYNYMVR
ncbi:hypothetical protein FACS189451_07870 [Bacteroidia bacterium]|nr:hypothetical protein FACS189451_07870 [Bacteroidia bacterium]